MEYFDIHKWKPCLCKTAEEMESALISYGVREKEIKEIHIIGLAYNLIQSKLYRDIRFRLIEDGISYDEIDSGQYPLDPVPVPCEVRICEPVVFIFTDGTTLEVMPKEQDGLLMSSGLISPDINDGTNHSNFDPNRLFSRIYGASIEDIQIIRRTAASTLRSWREETDSDIMYMFHLNKSGADFDYGVFFHRYQYEGWYTFGLRRQKRSWSCVDPIYKVSIPFAEFKTAADNTRQTVILEGHDYGGCFYIMPVKPSKEAQFGLQEYLDEEISIEESDVTSFLYYFLDKYYDDTFPYDGLRSESCSSTFQWNLEPNIYTYSTMKLILEDIENCSELIEKSPDDPRLNDLRAHFRWYSFAAEYYQWGERPSETEYAEIIRQNINIAVDFYKRFVRRMRTMIECSPEYDLISFMGP